MVLVVKDTVIPEDLVKDVVIKALKARIGEINQKLEDLAGSMDYFKRKYGMETEEFYQKFTGGEIGDEMDFFEWKSSWEIFNELKREKKALIEAIG
jgi:hypothetical protein